MTNSSDSDSQLGNTPKNLSTTDISQKVGENQGQIFGQMTGGIAVGQLIVYLSNIPTESTTKPTTTPSDLRENPYQGLKAFRETDGDRFFGRDAEIKELLKKFQGLHDLPNTVRVLPIYGPSGSGKSSLARAGLIPALGKQSLLGKDRCRVVVLTPGERPLESLATVLARIATNDPSPAGKTREFQGELLRVNTNQEYDGLRRIANVFPDINFSPLIILVDQFEEIYTYQAQSDDSQEKVRELDHERLAFVENLLCAASDRSQNVSVILTLRSDFLGKTQQHPKLNKLFSSQGFLVPIMQREQLAIAISEPARLAGYEIKKETVNSLIKDSQGQDGALPLLQFALMQIWEGLLQEPPVEPWETLAKIGGVGGALASEAKRIYESLTLDQQQIARSAFLSMVQLNEDNKATRRRATISEIMRDNHSEQAVRKVIECFAKPGVWILVTSSDKGKEALEMVEIAHEALINNWQELKVWLDLQWESLLKKRKIEDAALAWKNSQGYLWEGKMLRDAREFQQSHKNNAETSISIVAKEFLQASIKEQRNNVFKSTLIFRILPAVIAIASISSILGLIENVQVDRAKTIVFADDCEPSPNTREAIEYLIKKGYKLELTGIKLCKENIPEIDFSESDISEGDLREAKLGGAKFRKTFFINAKLQGAKLPEADLSDATLPNAQMQDAQLQNATLKGINLADANLQNAKLQGADLTNADLTNADLSGANLSNADLSGANLTGAKFLDVILTNSILIDSQGISINQIKQAKKICGIKLSGQFSLEYANEIKQINRLNGNCSDNKQL